MATLKITRMTARQRALIEEALRIAQGGASARTLSVGDVVEAYQRARRAGWATEHGGNVPNSYGYRARATAVAAVRYAGAVYLRIGRGAASSRPNGRGGCVDVSIAPHFGGDRIGPTWHPNGAVYRARLLRWMRVAP